MSRQLLQAAAAAVVVISGCGGGSKSSSPVPSGNTPAANAYTVTGRIAWPANSGSVTIHSVAAYALNPGQGGSSRPMARAAVDLANHAYRIDAVSAGNPFTIEAVGQNQYGAVIQLAGVVPALAARSAEARAVRDLNGVSTLSVRVVQWRVAQGLSLDRITASAVALLEQAAAAEAADLDFTSLPAVDAATQRLITSSVGILPPPIEIAVSPVTASLPAGGTQTFTAQVTGVDDTRVVWSIAEGPAGGAITAAGRYTAPRARGTYHVVATSVVDRTKSATATVTVAAGGGIIVVR